MFTSTLKKVIAVSALCAGLILVLSGFGGEGKVASTSAVKPVAATSLEASALKQKLTSLIGVEVAEVHPTPVKGIVEVVTNQGLFYTSEDGNYLFHGQLFALGDNISNLTEQSLAKVRVEGMAKFADDMIVFPAKDEKYVVTVFTDITCAYCRKLHSQMADYNAKGITIRYLAYPRSGIKDPHGNLTKGFKDMRSVWCSDDPQQALTDGKNGAAIAYRICDKPVEQEFDFGRQVGVNGTPAIMLANGYMLPGYRKPDDLLAVLENFK